MPSAEANLPDDRWRVQAWSKAHRREGFDCGEPTLNEYLHQFIGQDTRRSLTRSFVLTRKDELRVFGYYTLSAFSIERERFPVELIKKLPRYPIPAILLGRLAVDQLMQGQRLGAYLLIDALKRIAAASATIGVYAVVVEALHDRAAAFYRDFGFTALNEQRHTLFLPMETVVNIP